MPTTRRTNSLAFAKSDCHTCAALSLHCDRQRPRCSICQASGRLCQGYSMPLTWRRCLSTSNKPPKVQARAATEAGNGVEEPSRAKCSPPQQRRGSGGDRPQSTVPREFMFVAGRPAKRRKRHHAQENTMVCKHSFSSNGAKTPEGQMPSLTAAELQTSPFYATVCPGPILDDTSNELPSSRCHSIADSTWELDHLDPVATPDIEIVDALHTDNLEQCLQIQYYGSPREIFSSASPGSAHGSCSERGYVTDSGCTYQSSLSYIPEFCFSTIHDKFSGLLNMCKQS